MLYIENLIILDELEKSHPISSFIKNEVIASRKRIEKILQGKDHRLLVIIGPCSIHDIKATLDYASRLKILRDKYLTHLEIVMRTYFEKPRTITGWKGLIFDPDLDGSYRVNRGITLARKLLLRINEIGIPAATEFLDTFIHKFIIDLISWGSIGARTTESQIHRAIASSLSCPIGFKNSTNGNIRIAIDAILSSRVNHIFLSLDNQGKITICRSNGNPSCHIVMRGGKTPNYYAENISSVCKILRKFYLFEKIVVDFSHGNCQKKYHRQLDVCENICQQIQKGSFAIVGVMVESFLKGGSQKISIKKSMTYGQSITDPCLSWEESEELIDKLALAVESRF